MTDTLVILAVGIVGGLAARVIRIPGGSLLGAMAAVGALQLAAAAPMQISPGWGTVGQLLVGAAIGSTMDRRMIRSFRSVLVPGAFAVGSMVLSGVIIGTGFAVLGFADPLTSLFGLAPGGFAEMTAAATALGASGPVVASMHLVRVIAVIVLLPFILRPVARWAVRRDAELRRETTGGATRDA